MARNHAGRGVGLEGESPAAGPGPSRGPAGTRIGF